MFDFCQRNYANYCGVVLLLFLLFRFDSGVDSIYDDDDSDLVSCLLLLLLLLLLFLFLFLFLFLQHTIVLLTTVVVF